MVHVGFTGGGNITETHIRAALAIPDVAVAGIYGSNFEKVSALCSRYGGTPHRSLQDLLKRRPLDLIIIGSPSGLHAEEGKAAARAGVHVLVEKPIDMSTKRADELIDIAANYGVKLGVIFQDRLKPDILRLRDWISSGRLGRPILVEASVKWYRLPEYYSSSRWRGTLTLDGGGALINQGIHTVDLLRYLMGEVAEVTAVTRTSVHEIEAEDTCVATLEFVNGALGVLHATTAAYPGYPRAVEITGTEGTVRLEQDRIVRLDLRSAVPEAEASEPGDQNSSSNSPVVNDVRGHQRIIEDFLRCIRTGGSAVCSGEEGRRTLEVVERIYRAAQSRDHELCATKV